MGGIGVYDVGLGAVEADYEADGEDEGAEVGEELVGAGLDGPAVGEEPEGDEEGERHEER